MVGIDPRPEGLGLAAAVSASQRRLLQEPGSVLVEAADLDKLGTAVGQTAEINGLGSCGRRGVTGLRSMGGVNVACSTNTARSLDGNLSASDDVTYYLVAATNRRLARTIQRQLNMTGRQHAALRRVDQR